MTVSPLSSQNPTPDAREKLIVALDYPDAASALRLVDQMQGTCLWYKVGLELYLSAGRAIVDHLVNSGYKVFLDLKLHDIPNTVASAVRTVAPLGAELLTVHASGGPAMLAAAHEAAASIKGAPRLLAVTVLTSMDSEQLTQVGILNEPLLQVERLAQVTISSGINGFVCSSLESGLVRSLAGVAAEIVVPGIRPANSAVGDQRRIATPASAIAGGASRLVVGRPITQAVDPSRAAASVLEEIRSQLIPA